MLAALEAVAPKSKAKLSVLRTTRKTSNRPIQRARKSSAVASRKLSDDRPNQHARKSSSVASSLRLFPNLALPERFASPGKESNPIVIDD